MKWSNCAVNVGNNYNFIKYICTYLLFLLHKRVSCEYECIDCDKQFLSLRYAVKLSICAINVGNCFQFCQIYVDTFIITSKSKEFPSNMNA